MQRQPYSQQAVLENENLISKTADKLVQRIKVHAQDFSRTRCVDVFPLCGLFSLEVICKAAFNKEWSDLESGASSLLQAMDESAKLLPIDAALPFLKRFGIGEYVPGLIGRTFKEFRNWSEATRKLLRDFQQDEVSRDRSQRFMATPLIMAEDGYLGRVLTEDEAVEEAMGIAFAGSGTTSTTLVYLLYNLSLPENISHQQKLREELRAAGETLHQLQNLPYLNAVIKETMRLNPTIISTLPRVLDVDLPLAKTGFALPAGTIVGMQNYVHHRDASIFPDPECFRPERWLGNCDLAENSITPFSLGPRNCIGQNLARAELYLAVSRIFRQLSLTLSKSMKESDMEMEDRFNIAPRGRKLFLDVKIL
ncbi:hypothetical protein H2198_010524 [Neophaeococcomyces mojaviensis]|uniref:Uncharacterized protein n=1 Tax=Neophaeococcomyces mojaviensis TaxID=3383035 RepID=A0ACC2ZRK3_9EURO|nr:hypothetical protein H2198_010524 [Knufia sp. JES_112]